MGSSRSTTGSDTSTATPCSSRSASVWSPRCDRTTSSPGSGVMSSGSCPGAAAAAVAWKIQQTCMPGFEVRDEVVHVSANVGIAVVPDHGKTTAELLRRADAAMYVAKRTGSGHAVFDRAHETQADRKL